MTVEKMAYLINCLIGDGTLCMIIATVTFLLEVDEIALEIKIINIF